MLKKISAESTKVNKINNSIIEIKATEIMTSEGISLEEEIASLKTQLSAALSLLNELAVN